MMIMIIYLYMLITNPMLLSILRAHRLLDKVHAFLNALLHQESQVSVDVYAYMFFCDFFNFFVLIFGFSAFGVSFISNFVGLLKEYNNIIHCIEVN